MRRYKALLVDFDGTLANPHTGEISSRVTHAIQSLLNQEYLVSLATGRPYFGRIKVVCEEICLTSPQIVHGGAEIRNPHSDAIVWSQYLANSDVAGIVQYFLAKKIYFSIEKDHFVFTPDGKHGIYSNAFIAKKIDSLLFYEIPKIIVPSSLNSFTFEELEVMIADLERKFPNIHVVKGKIGDHFGIDITSGGATKHTAALEYMKLLQIKPEEVVGVGDGYNDYPLLTACGTKVAMGDAPKELKEIADWIAPSWEENGLVEVIKRYFLS